MKISTELTVFMMGLGLVFAIVIAIIGYNLYTGEKTRELYEKCLGINQQIIDGGGRDYLYCRL